MFPQAIIAFFLILHFRKRLRAFSPGAPLERAFNTALIALVALLVLESTLQMQAITKWISHALVLLLITLPYQKEEFSTSRTLMAAVMPVVFIFLLNDIVALFDALNDAIGQYLDFAISIAITWMITRLILSRKQQKALLKEQQKRAEEAEQNKIIAARKAELEALVIERTEALTLQKEELEHALTDLKATQSQLVQREKMASLGELTAGIAHEIQNPLNFVNNFSETNVELIEEMEQALLEGNMEGARALAADVKGNEQKIFHHSKRADAIIKGMLQHSRKNTGQKEPTDINALADEYLRLSYHGLRAKDKSFNASLQTHFDERIKEIYVVPQDMGRVLLNLINNAFYAVQEKAKGAGEGYEPTVMVSTKQSGSHIEIEVQDNGMGISKSLQDKIFQPFFTTKPAGEGTGLGLSLSYDIVKAHGGELTAKSTEGSGTTFTIALPYAQN